MWNNIFPTRKAEGWIDMIVRTEVRGKASKKD